MRIKSFVGTVVIVAVVISLSGCISNSIKNDKIKTKHTFTDFDATISISNLKEPVKILHITDSHISIVDNAEKEYHEYAGRMDKAYREEKNYKTGKDTKKADEFLELMDIAKVQKVDLILLTGDIINNPSKSSRNFVQENLQKTGIPYIFVAGNHDWHYEGMDGSANELRETWIQNTLLPLYNGKNPLYSSQIVKGINFVVIDNSTYQITQKQLDFYKDQIALDKPIVLLMHIPLYLDKDGEKDAVHTCGDPRWGWDMDHGYEAERRERWSRTGNDSTTLEFCKKVMNSNNLVAILTGHTHIPRADKVSETAVQYVSGIATNGQHRIVTFKHLQ